MKTHMRFFLVVTLFILVVSLFACQQAPTQQPTEVVAQEVPTQQPTKVVAQEVPTQQPTEDLKDKRLKIVSLVQPLDNPWVVNNVRFQKAVAEALNIELIVIADEGTEDSNMAAMESIMAMNPDGVLFDPITSVAGVRDAALLEENKIPGCTQDRLVVANIKDYVGDYLICAATIDTQKWGYNMMMALINQGSTKISAIMDPKGVLTVEQAWEGALQAVSENPGVVVVQESWQQKGREQGMETMERYLTAYGPGEMDGVYVFGSTTGLGALYAIEQAGRQDEIKVSTCDIDDDVAALIKEGRLASSMDGHWMLGGYGLIMLNDYLKGFEPIKRQPQFPLIGADPTNIDKYKSVFLDSLPYTNEEIQQLSKVYNPDANVADALENLYLTWDK